MKFGGWIAGDPGDREFLRKLGVKGEMIYNGEKKCFEYCDLSFWRVIYVWVRYPKFYSGAFTNLNGNWQPFW